VRRRHLFDPRVPTLGHESLSRRRNGSVRGAQQVPRRDGPPPRRPRGRGRAGSAPRALRRRHHCGCLGVDVGGKRLGEQFTIQVQVEPLASVRVRERHRSQRCRYQTVREDLRLKELLDALPFVGHPPIDEHQRLHLLVPGSGVGHDRAAVGVADQDNRAGDGAQQGRQVRSVIGRVAERVGEPMAANPRSRTARIDSPKPVASAHAPWTNTMVGVSAVTSSQLLRRRLDRCANPMAEYSKANRLSRSSTAGQRRPAPIIRAAGRVSSCAGSWSSMEPARGSI
jgi:hypothetical protein